MIPKFCSRFCPNSTGGRCYK